MANTFKIYTARDVTIAVGPVVINDGRPEGTFIKITTPEKFGVVQGIDGDVARYYMQNRVYRAELTLLQTSSHHAELNALFILDDESGNGAGVVPFFMKDENGTSLIASEFAWCVKAPDAEFGQEVKEASPWIIDFVADVKQVFTQGA